MCCNRLPWRDRARPRCLCAIYQYGINSNWYHSKWGKLCYDYNRCVPLFPFPPPSLLLLSQNPLLHTSHSLYTLHSFLLSTLRSFLSPLLHINICIDKEITECGNFYVFINGEYNILNDIQTKHIVALFKIHLMELTFILYASKWIVRHMYNCIICQKCNFTRKRIQNFMHAKLFMHSSHSR